MVGYVNVVSCCFAVFVDDSCWDLMLGCVVNGYGKLVCAFVSLFC